MDMQKRVVVDFQPGSNDVAHCAEDGPLRIWEAETWKLKNEYLPSAHLSATCTCLKFRQVSARQQKRKKSKKPSVNDVSYAPDDNDLVAFGSAAGNINLYSVSKGEIKCQLTGEHTSPITDICWADSSSLISSSSDGLIVQWDLHTAKQRRKWKCGRSGISALSLCGSSHLVAAGHSISLYSLDSLSEVKTFTGHSTEVIQVHVVSPGSSDENDGAFDVGSAYLISLAHGDRVISLWSAGSKSSKSKRAKASFILDSEPKYSTLHYDQDLGSLKLAVLTTADSVEVFDHHLNSHAVKKPIAPVSCVQLTTPGGKTIPMLGCKLTASDKLLIIYGTAVCPAFETLDLTSLLGEPDVRLQRDDPNSAPPVTRVTSVGNIRQPRRDGEVTTLTPAMEGARKPGSKKQMGTKPSEKRQLEDPEVTIGEKLAMLRSSGAGLSTSDVTGPVESLSTLLSQGLQSEDSTILHKVLQHGDINIINTTIRRLPIACVMPLMRHLTLRLERYGSSSSSAGQGGVTTHTTLIKWVRALLHVHASYLAAFPELMERLQRMYSIMENRVVQLGTFTRLQGRLELMLSQIARQKDKEDGSADSAAATALLTLQDESSEDEMVEDLDVMLGAHSESEDGYLSAEEDDLMKA